MPTSVVEFTVLTVDCTSCQSDDDLRARCRQALSETLGKLSADTAILRVTLTGATSRHWHIRRDAEAWTQTIQDIALETGRLWVEKITLHITPESDAPDTSTTGELQNLMAQIADEDGFAATLQAEVDAMLNDLPPALRPDFVPDADAAAALARELTQSGSADILARMKGASD